MERKQKTNKKGKKFPNRDSNQQPPVTSGLQVQNDTARLTYIWSVVATYVWNAFPVQSFTFRKHSTLDIVKQ